VSRFIVPFAPGGALDLPARMIAQQLGPALGSTFIVENRPGAGGAVGAQAVIQGAADGSMLLFTSSSVSIIPALQPTLGLDPIKDLQPISLVCDVASVLVVRANSRFTSVQQIITEAKSAPGRVSYGSPGLGSSNHLASASFGSLAGIDMLHVPYRGNAQTLNAIYAGDIDFMFVPTLDILGHIREGTLRALAVSLGERLPALPDIPTIAETVPGYAVSNWFAMFAPARLPEEQRSRLVKALATIRDWPDLKKRFDDGAALVRLDGPDPLAKRMAEDTAKWAQLIPKLGIKAE
jgi:tripartite-type tricarboxylate transporter receptor subunit TctC